jgi:hypothetical protein
MDKFILKDKSYKDRKNEKQIEKDIKFKDLEYLEKPLKREDYLFKDKIAPQQIFDKEKFLIKENGDNLLNNWLKTQKDPLVVFLSEFIPNTKISKELEQFKPIIKTTPVISIEEYRKKKKIGEEGVHYLKKLKEKYGNIVLKVLWANLNFKG